mmetsp:Transcript_27214/g.59040  ORF Transcript_27214/g.59040 Transcript_27214/m.59040 type:complete len:93 (-) Transcript_27214:1471-1749(-)
MSGGSNSHPHPKVDPGSSGWNAFAESNKYDVQLYDYALALFEEQSKLFESDKYFWMNSAVTSDRVYQVRAEFTRLLVIDKTSENTVPTRWTT